MLFCMKLYSEYSGMSLPQVLLINVIIMSPTLGNVSRIFLKPYVCKVSCVCAKAMKM